MKYLYSFLLGLPFSLVFFLVIHYLNDNRVIFIISIILVISLIRVIANPILKKLSDSEKFESSLSLVFLLGLAGPLFILLTLI